MTIMRSNVRKLRFALNCIFVASVFAIGVIAQEQPSQSTASATNQNSPQPVSAFDTVTQKDAVITPDSSLRIGAGDLLEFSVYNVPELSTKTLNSSKSPAPMRSEE